MAKVLVVDDSPVDLCLASGLLRNLPDIEVESVASGSAALESMQRDVPDLALIDILMPEMSGVELVKEIRSQFPLVATVLMTSRGNEDAAIQALLKGATSYVPKRELANQLTRTIHGVLQSTKRVRSRHRLMSCLSETTCKFLLENDCQLIAPLVGHVQELLNHVCFGDETDRMQVGVALDEALANAVYHGNLEISSDIREKSGKEFHQIVEERRLQSPYRDRRVVVEASISPKEVQFAITDEGPGFDPSSLPDPTDAANLENITGRGILLMRTFMDTVTFCPEGKSVTLVKHQNNQPQHS
jgi:CheY-like chemotaxis protein/anti-sigma regulatory factor (Ser/Thr protein kinase)